ncbi:MAG: hypothetical protein CL933_02095 [Deltaproteobacteria bacterium]|nr:hypothetical protein [Deltaproteobacteria bacterium]
MTDENPPATSLPIGRGARAFNRVLEVLPPWLAKIGARQFRCEPGVKVKTPTRLTLGRGVTLQRRSLLHCGGKSWCGYGGAIALGHYVVIGPNCVLYGAGRIVIGDYTHLGPGAMIMTQSGVVGDDSRFSVLPKRIHEPVEIGQGVWIGAGAVLVGGTRLGDGCTVSPNSVVSGEYGPGTTLVGNPARVARMHSIT